MVLLHLYSYLLKIRAEIRHFTMEQAGSPPKFPLRQLFIPFLVVNGILYVFWVVLLIVFFTLPENDIRVCF